ncbi:MAG: DNA repair protein RecN [Lachnospiraceae bacterium]|nr:DNA repair protein RecN [Lachnospiraceae bacterium]
MLRNLHIKNLALIREIDVDFTGGLNILTGETGAGKSIIIDSIGMALGGKTVRRLIRDDAPSGLVELVFEIDDPEILASLGELGIDPEDGVVLISRKMQGSRSVIRINGETRTAAEVRAAGALLLDIHGQSEHQKLLHPEQQLALIDAFGREEIALAKEKTAASFRAYAELKKQLEGGELSEEERSRRISFLEFEVQEIEACGLREGEDEEIETLYRKMKNARRIVSAAGTAHELTGYDSEIGAGDTIGRAIRELDSASEYDGEIGKLLGSLSEIDELLGDFNRSLADYLSGLEFEEEEFSRTEERLDLINRMKSKYGRTIRDILASKSEKERELAGLYDYEEERRKKQAAFEKAEAELAVLSKELTELRKKYADSFAREVMKQLAELNFARSDFAAEIRETADYSANGRDAAVFRIATNPGEPMRDLEKVVSGGELSRIMLGIKTMFAAEDKTETLIFDEVDTGISGRTAQKVAEKLSSIAENRQVLCITHLPQIAAMADTHYAITKELSDSAAITKIEALSEEESIMELARLLGGEKITENTIKSSREMKEMCRRSRNIVL